MHVSRRKITRTFWAWSAAGKVPDRRPILVFDKQLSEATRQNLTGAVVSSQLDAMFDFPLAFDEADALRTTTRARG